MQIIDNHNINYYNKNNLENNEEKRKEVDTNDKNDKKDERSNAHDKIFRHENSLQGIGRPDILQRERNLEDVGQELDNREFKGIHNESERVLHDGGRIHSDKGMYRNDTQHGIWGHEEVRHLGRKDEKAREVETDSRRDKLRYGESSLSNDNNKGPDNIKRNLDGEERASREFTERARTIEERVEKDTSIFGALQESNSRLYGENIEYKSEKIKTDRVSISVGEENAEIKRDIERHQGRNDD